jgi:hypothetical protein
MSMQAEIEATALILRQGRRRGALVSLESSLIWLTAVQRATWQGGRPEQGAFPRLDLT